MASSSDGIRSYRLAITASEFVSVLPHLTETERRELDALLFPCTETMLRTIPLPIREMILDRALTAWKAAGEPQTFRFDIDAIGLPLPLVEALRKTFQVGVWPGLAEEGSGPP